MIRAAVLLVFVMSACDASDAAQGKAPPAAPTAAPAAPARPATAPAAAVPPVGSINADLDQLPGKPLYLALCRPCHGDEGKGYAADHAPSLVNPTFLASASDEFLARSIAAGRPATSMPAYGRAQGGPLDDAAIARLVTFLRDQGPAAQPLAAVAPGDATAGGALYGKYCRECHGETTTRGDSVWLGNTQFQAAASDAFVRYAIVHGRPGTKMEAFGSVLSGAELDGLVAYIRTFGAASPAAGQLPPPTGKEPVVTNPRGGAPSFTLRGDPCPPTSPDARGSPPCKSDLRYVSSEQVAKALAAGRRIAIVDARPPSDWMRVHITGAVSIPYHDLTRLDELPRDGTWIVAYCACPHHLSGIVVDELRKRGYTHTAVLDEGITEWHRRGLPVVAAPGVTKPPAETHLPEGTFR